MNGLGKAGDPVVSNDGHKEISEFDMQFSGCDG